MAIEKLINAVSLSIWKKQLNFEQLSFVWNRSYFILLNQREILLPKFANLLMKNQCANKKMKFQDWNIIFCIYVKNCHSISKFTSKWFPIWSFGRFSARIRSQNQRKVLWIYSLCLSIMKNLYSLNNTSYN